MTVSTLHLCLALLMALISSMVSEDFCQAFRDNGDKIDYLYHREVRGNESNDRKSYQMIIKQVYWTFHFIYGKRARVEFNSSDSGSAPLFTNKYFGAACLWTTTESCETLLFPDEDNITFVDVITLPGDDYQSAPRLSEYVFNRSVSATGFELLLKPRFAYSDRRSWANPGYLEFAVVQENNPRGYLLQIYKISLNNETLLAHRYWPQFSVRSRIHNEIAVWNHGGDSWPNDNQAYLLLTNDNLVINWCYLHIYPRQQCDKRTRGLLADCSHYSPRTDTKTDILYIIIGAVIAGVLIIIALVVCIVWFTRSGHSTPQLSSVTMKSSLATKKDTTMSNTFGAKRRSKKLRSKSSNKSGWVTGFSSKTPSMAAKTSVSSKLSKQSKIRSKWVSDNKNISSNTPQNSTNSTKE